MSTAVTTTSENSRPKTLRGRVISILAALGLTLGLALAPAPAFAADALCDHLNDWPPKCGQIHVNGESSKVFLSTVRVATNYVNSTTVTGVTAAIPRGSDTTTKTTSTGKYRDWDAFSLPAGYCARLAYGVGWIHLKTVKNTGTASMWVKVDNWGARIDRLKTGTTC